MRLQIKSKEIKENWVKQVFRKWADEASRNDCDPLGVKHAPAWVFNAYVELAKVVFPRGWLPVEKWDAEFLGEFLGRYSGMAHFFADEVPLGPETRSEMEKLKAMIANQPKPKNLKAIQKDGETIFEAAEKMIPLATASAANSTYSD
jgi:hypothetical protein